MNHSPSVRQSLQASLRHFMPLSDAQAGRVSTLGEALILAGEVPLTKLARFLPQRTDQDSRVRWIRRLFQAPYLQQAHLYPSFIGGLLAGIQLPVWHLVIDRTTLWEGKTDLATVALHYHRRAIPLAWCRVPFGGAPLQTYVALVRQAATVVPATIDVIFHGDTEFGGTEMIQALRQLGWDFILAQPGSAHFRRPGQLDSAPLSSLPVNRSHSVAIANIQLFAEQRLARLNVLAFYQPHHSGGQRKREICYLVTSLPLSQSVRRLGRRRWGTEPFYRDYKSSGWQVTLSQLKHPACHEGLLLLIAIVYSWTVCCGRWLCQTSRRHEVDSKAKRQRHLSLFRIGWDWLIHQLRCQDPIPIFLRLPS